MGMFDYVQVEYPLPGKYADMQYRAFQTKSWLCIMDTLTITKNGLLLDGMQRDVEFHGDIWFYDFRIANVYKNRVNFRARFTRGRLESIMMGENT